MKTNTRFTDWKKSKLLHNDDRREIADRCRSEANSIQDLARAMGLNPGSVHNHVHKLYDAGFLEVESTREINGILERKYRRTSAFFSLFHVAAKDRDARNRAIGKLASKRVAACLARGPRPQGLFDINARVSKCELAKLGAMVEELRKAVIAADGSGDLPISSFVVLGQIPSKKRAVR